MLSNYLTVMLRHMRRHLLHSTINVLGLTMGIAFALLIGLYVRGEWHVNQSLSDVDNLYLLETVPVTDGPQFFTPIPLLPRAQEQHPAMFKGFYRFWDRNITVSNGEKHLRIQSMVGDPTLITLFGFKLLDGNAETALQRPNTMVITDDVARQFFNSTTVVGNTLQVSIEGGGKREYEVTAVIAQPEKKNSVTDLMNMNAQIFLSSENRADFSMGAIDVHSWNDISISYVRLGDGVAAAQAQSVLQEILRRDAPPQIYETNRLLLKPLSDYYQLTNHGTVRNLIVSLTWVVAFILLLAVANFVNITISGSFNRMKEVGVRKAIGSLRRQVFVQCLMESVTLSVISGILAIFIYEVMNDYVGLMLSVQMPSIMALPATVWLTIIPGVLLIGLVAGIYPALYLSATRTIESLKGKFRSVSTTINFSRTLVGVQFGVSVFVLTSAVIISMQINYFLNKDLGFDRSQVLVATSVPRWWNAEGLARLESAKREMAASPSIESLSLSIGSPAMQLGMGSLKIRRAGQPPEEGVNAHYTAGDEDFARVYGISVVDGRFLVDDNGSVVPSGVVINESASKALSVGVGDQILMESTGDRQFPIVGVVADFHSESLHEPVKPVVIVHTREPLVFRFFSFKLRPGNLAESVAEVERAWRKALPEEAFMASFADERVEQQYRTELNLRRAATLGSALMLVIVLTGVLGLVALTVAKRTKEMGIRKVLGANTAHVLGLLAREYVIVLSVAIGIGIPVSYRFVSGWLDSFVYQVDVPWWMFVVPALAVFVLTLTVVAARGMKAAWANPAKSLRYE